MRENIQTSCGGEHRQISLVNCAWTPFFKKGRFQVVNALQGCFGTCLGARLGSELGAALAAALRGRQLVCLKVGKCFFLFPRKGEKSKNARDDEHVILRCIHVCLLCLMSPHAPSVVQNYDGEKQGISRTARRGNSVQHEPCLSMFSLNCIPGYTKAL